MKITKIKETGIRKAKTEENEVFAIIGQVKELLEKEIIFDENTKGNENKWLGIEKGGEVIREFETLEEPKEYYKNK